MSIEFFEILIAGLISYLSLKTEMKNEQSKKLTIYGYFVLALTVTIIVINFYNYFDKNAELKILKENEIYAEIEISTNSKAKMDSIFSILPNKLNLRDVKIGNDSFQIDFEKEMANSGKAKSFESWHIYYKSVFIKFDELRLDSKTIKDLNGKTFEINIPELNKINCDKSYVNVQFYLKIRDKSSKGYIECNENYRVKLENIK